jgi:hypothetical protein
MKYVVSLLLFFTIGCTSYREFNDNEPRKNCASDKTNKSVICDLRLQLYSDDKWTNHSFIIIEKYTLNDLRKTDYHLILRLSLNNVANFETAIFSIDGKTYTLKASKVTHDETYDFREVVYFDIGMEFIKTLAGGKDIELLMIGTIKKEYHIDEKDIPSIRDFYNSL